MCGVLHHFQVYVGPCYWEHSWGITSIPGICSAWVLHHFQIYVVTLLLGTLGGIIPRTVARAGLTRTKPHLS